MFKEILLEVFERDLSKLKEEINLYKKEEHIWKIDKEIKNSAGNICLHVIGNLNYFIGSVLGNSGYVRDRESEFILKDISREKLISSIDEVSQVVKTTLSQLSSSDFEKTFPVKKQDRVVTTEYMLFHLATHLNYHLGQINYHRRFIS